MINITNKEKCCGCTACQMICPKEAITMQPDILGFLYPHVDMDKCIECGLCEKVCTFNNNYNNFNNLPYPDVFAVRHKDIKEIETSRSGAMFIAISDYILDRDGAIYGAGYTDHFRVIHKRAINKIERNEFKGSKYVQSDMNTVYKQVKNDLENDQLVLFSGTPCQTSSLQTFLTLTKTNVSKLYTCDVVCHGVPSPYIWKDYLKYIKDKYKKDIIKVEFRDKSLGWKSHKESFILNSGEKIIETAYTDLFYKHIILRPSCGNCKYTNTKRPSDITIADYWGWEKLNTDFNKDDKGCSLTFINTNKGKRIWENININLNYLPSDLSICMQPNLMHPSRLSINSTNFVKLYEKRGLKKAMIRYGNTGWRYLYKEQKKKLKNSIKKYL